MPSSLFITHLGLCNPADYPEIAAARGASKRRRGELGDITTALNNVTNNDVLGLLQRHVALTTTTLNEHNERLEHINDALNEADEFSEAIDERVNTFSAKAGAMARESAREYTDARVQALEGMVERLIDRVSFLESRERERELQEAQHDVDSQVTQMYDSSDESSPDSPESVLVGLTENLSVDDAM